MISKKAITALVFSAIVGVSMLAMPAKAMAHDWDHDGDGGHGRHNGWYNHGGGNHGWFQRGEDEEDEHEGQRYYQPRGYYQQPGYGWGYGQRGEDEDENQGYGFGGYGQRGYGWNGNGMVNPRHPGLMWACDSQGHHCHWARRYGNGYGYGNGYYGNGYGNGYQNYGYRGNNGNYGMSGLGSLLGIPLP